MDDSTAKSQKIDALIVKPGEPPYMGQIDNTLKGQQEAVGGLIEYVYMEQDAILVCNEEGMFTEPLNRTFGLNGHQQGIFGTFFIAGDTGENLQSLSPSQISHFTEKFQHPEAFMKVRVDNDHSATLSFSTHESKIVTHNIENPDILASIKRRFGIQDAGKDRSPKTSER